MNLTEQNAAGYFELRLESIGGLGANLLGKMLGELGVMLGLNAASFSSYGSEKRGSPVQSYIRWSEREIQDNSPITRPHVLGLFHERMAETQAVTAGADEQTKTVVNAAHSPQEMAKKLKLCGGEIYCVDALKIAMESKTRVNMVMLGAIVRACGFVPLEKALELVKKTVGKKYPDLLEANLAGVRRGYDEAEGAAVARGKYPPVPYTRTERRWGYTTAPLGGANPCIGSTVQNDLSASREGYIPLFLPEKCIHCGLCDSTCPDLVFQFTEGERNGKPAMLNRGLDYRHCKGCLRCVEICPTEALVCGLEREHPNPKHWVKNRDLVADEVAFRPRGADAVVTGEAYLDERRVDGGLV